LQLRWIAKRLFPIREMRVVVALVVAV